MDEKKQRKEYGRQVEALRTRLGWGREQFGKAVGNLSSETIRMVENGHQNLGKAARAAVERLAGGELRETEGVWHASLSREIPPDLLEWIADIALDDTLKAKAEQIGEVANCGIRRAMTFVVREEIERRRAGK